MTYAAGEYLDQFRLDVEWDRSDTLPENLIQNPSGELGSWGYTTPAFFATVASGVAAGQPYLEARTSINKVGVWLTERAAVTPGRRVAFRVNLTGQLVVSTAQAHWRARVQFYDGQGVQVGAGPWKTIVRTPADPAYGIVWTDPSIVPGNAATADVRMELGSEATFNIGPGSSGGSFRFREAMLASASTDLPLGFDYQPPVHWHAVAHGPTTSLDVDRKGLDVGLLVAKLIDATLDPAVSATLRPGRRVRVMVLAGGGETELFTGTALKALATYDKTKRGKAAGTIKTRIDLVAVDSAQRLANTPEPRGARTGEELRVTLEGKGVPWDVLGNRDHYQLTSSYFAPVAINDNASMLDQVAVTRDDHHAFAYVSRRGVLTYTANPTASGVTLSDEAGAPLSYTKADVSFATDELINHVTVKLMRTVEGTSTEVSYGPYTDALSVSTWGARAATFTIQDSTKDNEASARAFAETILSRNKTPVVKVRSLELRVDSTAMQDAVLALELTHTATVRFQGVDYAARVSGISHRITAKGWRAVVNFDQAGTVASPTSIPAPPGTDATRPVPDGHWQHFTPTDSGIGMSFVYGRYCLIGKTCHVQVRASLARDVSPNDLVITLPFPAREGFPRGYGGPVGTAFAHKPGVSIRTGVAVIYPANLDAVAFFDSASPAVWGYNHQPFSFTTGTEIAFNVTYEIA